MHKMSLLMMGALLLGSIQVFGGEMKVTHMDAKGAAPLVLEKKVTVLDIRTADEFSEGHIKDAKNIDFQSEKFEAGVSGLDKKQPYIVHCAGGGRSTRSLEVFKKLGFENIIHLDGGFKGWKDAGQPVAK